MSWQHHGRDLARPEAGEAVTLASDADRDAAVGVLNQAFAEGRLTADEHAERLRAAYAARTWRELARLTTDLPGPAGSSGASDTTGREVTGVPGGLDRCLLCALLILCPPAGIAWLLVARHRSGAGRRYAVTAGGGRFVSAAPGAARAGDGWRAKDR
jgi:Domain of unknown function (DUF1707)